ncbi:MAG: ABC transporter permease [Clostridia bacterium]
MLKKANTRKIVFGILAVTAFLLLWYFGTNGTRLGNLMPGPVAVFKRLIRSTYETTGKYTLFGHILTSLSRVMTGFLLAAFLGITLGLAMGWSKSTEAIVKPLFEIIRPIPPIAWISIAVIWFGLGEGAKYFIIFISGFANITINVYTGARSVDPELIGAARMLGCSDRKIFTTIVIPSSIPYIFTGLQIAISSSWAAVVAAEMVRSTDGIGWMITSGQGIGDMEQIMVGIIAIGVIGFLLATIMRGVEAKLCAWSRVQD